MTTADKRDQIWQSFNDREYRHQFVDEEINVGIAFQIRSLRNRQDLKQGDLAKLLGVKQPLISLWEDPGYGKYSLATLKDLAKAFDVGLLVRFVPFSKLLDWTVGLTSDVIAPPSFSEEQYSVTTSTGTTLYPTQNTGEQYFVAASSVATFYPPQNITAIDTNSFLNLNKCSNLFNPNAPKIDDKEKEFANVA